TSTTVPGAASVPAAGRCAITVPGVASPERRRVTVPSASPSCSRRVRASACDRPSRPGTAMVGAPRLTTTVTGAPGARSVVAAGRGLLQRQTQHAWYDIVSVQDGGGKENEVRRQIPYHDGSDEGESPTSRPGQVAEGGQLPFLQRRDVTAELHQRVRAKRAAYAPSIPSRCGRDCRSPSGVSRAAGTAAGTGARPNSGWQARNSVTMSSFSSGSSEQVL